jgi:hypothetical protein
MGHAHGILLFEILIEVATGGGAVLKNIVNAGKVSVGKMLASIKNGKVYETLLNLKGAGTRRSLWCDIIIKGCFVSGTLVHAADGQIAIQDLNVGDLIYTSTSITSTERGSEEIRMNDIYTSTGQRAIDRTDIAGSKWYLVNLEGISQDIKLSLLRPEWWIEGRNIENQGDSVQIYMPENQIKGKFRVKELNSYSFKQNTSHGRPIVGFDVKPITGKFERTVDKVLQLVFDHSDTIEVTAAHPFYSLDYNGWRIASELQIGETILDKEGNAQLTNKVFVSGKKRVYNLEVRAYHNYLVGSNGVVVHNNYVKVDELRDLINKLQVDNYFQPGNVYVGHEKLLKALSELDGLLYQPLNPKLNKFIEDFRSGSKINLKQFGADGRMVKGWDKLSDLPPSIRTKVLNLEVADKLDGLVLHTNPIEADKLIKNIVEGIDQLGANGTYVLNKIKGGGFDDIPGYKELIKGIKKTSDPNANVANEVRQTFKHLDNTSVPNNQKVLGHKSDNPQFDIDYAEKTSGGSPLYDKAYQFKTTANASSVHNRLKSADLNKQIKNADANERILQVEIRSGTIADVESGQYFAQRLQDAKNNIPGFKLIITDLSGAVLKTY